MDKVIGIIGAMEVEIDGLRDKMQITRTTVIAGMSFYKGTLGKTTVVLAQCGIGKAYAAACTQAMIMEFKPDYIINIGVCGGLSKALKTGDIIVGEKTLQYDMDATAIGIPVGMITGIDKIYFDCCTKVNAQLEEVLSSMGMEFQKGIVATGDKFINDPALVSWLKDNFNAVAGDMESAAIGHVCYINSVPFGILRSISDNGDESSGEDYKAALDYAARMTVDIIEALCKKTK